MNEDRTVAASPRHLRAKRHKANKDDDIAVDALDAPTRYAIASEKRRHAHHPLQPGSTIKNRFRLEREIGRGGMGVVYAARDLIQEEVGEKSSLIAVKLLSEDFKRHPDALRMLQQECKKAQSLAHPNIGTVYDFDRDNNNVYMTMELLSGCSLQTYLKEHQQRGVSFEKAALILSDIVSGLDYAHRHHIIHSDLKPANIFLTEQGAKILDFGIARAVMDSEPSQINSSGHTSGDDLSIAQDGTTDEELPLTPSYASLEMFQGAPPDVRDDIYGLACIAYELLAGRHPFGKLPAKEVFDKQLTPKPVVGLKERQWSALLSGLAIERKDRIGSATEFLNLLLPKRKEPWRWAAYLFASVAVISAGLFLLTPDKFIEPRLFDNPPPAAKLTEIQQQSVDDILEVADVHMMVGRLVSPPGGNALDEYKKVLELNPYNRAAITGLRTLLNELQQQAKLALADGDVNRAAELIKIGLEVHGGDEGLLALKQRANTAQH